MAVGQTNSASDVLITLVPGPGALRHRLEQAILEGIASGRLTPGTALPPSRTLADTLGVSRWVVTEAYGYLVSKGVLDARTGAATRVAARARASLVELVETGTAQAEAGLERAPHRATHDLAPGVPDLRHVPREAWLRAAREGLAEATNHDLGGQPPAGHPVARETVAAHLRRARIVSGPDGAVVLTRGAADGISRIAAALADAGHTHLHVEDPSWAPLRDVAEAAGLIPVPVPVDDAGIRADRLRTEAARTGARAVLLTPAHQFPLGAVLSDERRAAVLAWAREVDGLVLEDDYDADFRYDRRPVPALQGHDPDRVLLLGSTSKTLAPAFGIGWMVVPERWRAAVLEVSVRRGPTPGPATLDQLTLARFVGDGAYARHLRAARARYARRRSALLAALDRELPGARVGGIAAGMHVTVDLARVDLPGVDPARIDAAAVVREGAARDVALVDLRRYQATPSASRCPACCRELARAVSQRAAASTAARRLRTASPRRASARLP